jgi:hypothetical protein
MGPISIDNPLKTKKIIDRKEALSWQIQRR